MALTACYYLDGFEILRKIHIYSDSTATRLFAEFIALIILRDGEIERHARLHGFSRQQIPFPVLNKQTADRRVSQHAGSAVVAFPSESSKNYARKAVIWVSYGRRS